MWDDTVFVTSAIKTDKQVEQESAEAPQRRRGRRGRSAAPSSIHQFVIFAINRSDGSIRWKQIAREEAPHEGTHQTGSWAANSPVTDGEHVYAYFGSRGLYCYDMQGNLQWEKDLGDMATKMSFGEGSSPVLYGDAIILNWDHEGNSFITVRWINGRVKWSGEPTEMKARRGLRQSSLSTMGILKSLSMQLTALVAMIWRRGKCSGNAVA